ncbi:hypothetical protein AAC387_Pa06g0089 [Persea americana]
MEYLWDQWLERALARLESLKLKYVIKPITLSVQAPVSIKCPGMEAEDSEEFEKFDSLQPWDRSSLEVLIDESTFQKWLDGSSPREEAVCNDRNVDETVVDGRSRMRELLLFSGSDYLGLGSHPTVRKAAAKAALQHGMGPRGSALICGQTNYHSLLESSLADLYKKEDCLLCPTGFAANEALMVAIGGISPLLAVGKRPSKDERVAFFSDALNHRSIIDGILLSERQQQAQIFVYRHCDMVHLDALLSTCTIEKKVVVTDSLFSMEGDFAPMVEIAELRKKHGFLWIIDEAHATLACGENGGGAAELFGCEDDVDICVGMLSKGFGCQGGFIACSKKWKELIASRGWSFAYSTSIPVPIAAAAHAALMVAKKEKWRRKAIWSRVQEFATLTQMSINSYIISFVIGSEEMAASASRHMLKCGFHVVEIRPPVVPRNSCRLRITLTAAHTSEDVKNLTAALSQFMKMSHDSSKSGGTRASKL